jgi:hypothetical protein
MITTNITEPVVFKPIVIKVVIESSMELYLMQQMLALQGTIPNLVTFDPDYQSTLRKMMSSIQNAISK